MNNNPLLCFEHCTKGRRVICEQLPSLCPICKQQLDGSFLRLPPFRLPSPFTTAAESAYSVVIKPTCGSFLLDYSTGADLHIGLVDSGGSVYEFSEVGLRVMQSEWTQCVSVALSKNTNKLQPGQSFASLLPAGTDHELYMQHWDNILNHSLNQNQWQMRKYSENMHNCYTYVLSVLKDLELKVGRINSFSKPLFNSGDSFCKELIVPRTAQAARYIALYRQVLSDGFFVEGI